MYAPSIFPDGHLFLFAIHFSSFNEEQVGLTET